MDEERLASIEKRLARLEEWREGLARINDMFYNDMGDLEKEQAQKYLERLKKIR